MKQKHKIHFSLIVIPFFLFLLIVVVYGQNITRTEMLGRPTDTSVSVKALFNAAVEARVCYGTNSGTLSDSTTWQQFNPDSYGDAVAVMPLAGLSTDTKYYYQLQYRKPGTTNYTNRPLHCFHTARVPGDTFTFVIQADPHLDAASDTALYRVCLQNQLADNPDFMIDLGDFLMSDKLTNAKKVIPEDTIPYRCKLLRSYYETINHSVPLFNVLGNHEGEEGWYLDGTANNVAVWDTKYRKKYFMNPLPDNNFYTGDTIHYNYVGQREAVFAWNWGDAQFIVLDPFWNTNPKPDSLTCWRWTLGKSQYDWLKTTLANSNAKYRFVFLHNIVGGNGKGEGRGGIETAPYYEWGGKNIDGTDGWNANRLGWDKPIKDLLKEYKATIMFHGHDHFYDKQELDCLLYQEVPQPSLPNFIGLQQATDYGYLSGVILPNSGHLRVTVSPSGVTVEYVRAVRSSQETSKLHNKDIAETYFVNSACYDSLSTGITQIQSNYNIITVYPNPVSDDNLIVKAQTTRSYDRCISLFNSNGCKVSSGILKEGETQVGLGIKNLNPGIYIVNVADGANSSTFKVVIAKR